MSLISDRLKTFYRERRWQSRSILALLALIIVLGTVRLLLPATIIYGTTSWLKKQGIDSTIEAINIDIINGTVSLVNAEGRLDGTPLFNVGLVEIYWHWAPLQEKTVVVTEVELDQLKVNIEQYSDEIIIGGVQIPLGKPATIETAEIVDEPDEQTEPWAASLGEVTFTDLNICYLQHTAPHEQASKDSLFVDYCVELGEMSWAGTISYATDKALLKTEDIPLSSTGDFSLSGLQVTDNKLNKKLLVSDANALDNVVISGLNSLHIDELDMNELSLLQRDDEKHRDSIRFSKLTINDINFSNLNTLAINNISMSDPGVYLVKNNETDWEYQQWIPTSSSTNDNNDSAASEKQTDKETSFVLTLNDISVNNSDLCYQDNATSVYYCLTFDDFDWDGSFKFGSQPSQTSELNLLAKGDLKLSQPAIHNQSLDRSLLNFDMLALARLEVNGADDVILNKLIIKKLAALQRSNDQKDNTASFDELIIDNFKYANNRVEIESVDIEGLANTVSKSKDGSWEHDKWSTKTKKTEQKGTAKTDKKEDGSEPLVIALKKVSLNSKKKISFTDYSTQPAMKVGLQSLALNISDIYSDRPESVTPFKLHAQTVRHSTVDLEGTAKPFADKVSLDAEGKLKGFDLRAASPATRKAIGHTIKSGQLDADLKLLAVDGVLDSNVGLTLYHFNIKATSKEDAKKLDDKFGMPLNQTLVLLRDKDDSIRLDIPITGDVNNPDFNPMDAIIKATSKAATVTLITFYTPYGLIYAGGNVAFDLATALNFDPIDFTPGSAEVLADGKDQLDNLSKLLTEKPQVHLTLCGLTNRQDVFKLYPETKEKHESNKKDEPKDRAVTLSAEQSSRLEKLARDRQVNSKNYLINDKGIAHDRLILCAPEHSEDEDAIAGVEVNI